MKVKLLLQEAVKSKALVALWVLLFVQTAIFVTITLFNIHPSQLQIITQCSQFNPANCMRGQWFYIANFTLFGIVYFIANILISLKILETKGRPMTLLFLWLSVGVLLTMGIVIISLLSVTGISFI